MRKFSWKETCCKVCTYKCFFCIFSIANGLKHGEVFSPSFFIQLYINTLTHVCCTQKIFKYNGKVNIPFCFRNMSSSHEQIHKIVADFVSNQNSMKSHESLEVKFRPHRTVQPDVIVISLPIPKPFTNDRISVFVAGQ